MYSLHYEKFANGSVKCIEDEIPFEVPEGWGWCRLTEITFEIFAGGDKPENYSKTQTDEFSIPIFANGTENDGLYGFTNKARVNKSAITVSARGTIGFCCIRHMPFVPIVRLITIVPAEGINIEYLRIVFQALIETGEGSSIPQLTVPGIKPKLIPIPPYSEQTRISNKLIETEKIVSAVELNQESVVNYIKLAKSKILDLAIRGQLVPQDPNDEPASVLLERIRAEKEELIKAGKIKRDKKESIIFKGDDNSYYETIGKNTVCIDEEIPFDIPDRWTWCRLQSISSILTDGTHKTPEYSDSGYMFLSSKNVTSGKIDWENVMYIPEYLHEELYGRLAPAKDDILLAKNGTTGVAAIVDHEEVFDIYVSLALIRIINNMIFPEYILHTIGSSYIQNYFNSSLKGIGVPNLHLEHIRKTLIPIPTYTEQKLIAGKIKHILFKIDDISNALL